jgi:hypothetical protein
MLAEGAAAIPQRAAIEKVLTHLGLDPRPPPRGRASEACSAFAADSEARAILGRAPWAVAPALQLR